MLKPSLQVKLRDLFWIVLLLGVLLGWSVDHARLLFKGRSLQWHSQVTLLQDAAREICLTEHSAGGFLSTPIWQVWQRRGGEENWEPLFTVVPGFQEREPGLPELSADGKSISDNLQSYAFDVERGNFVTNKHRSSAYLGPFRCALPRD